MSTRPEPVSLVAGLAIALLGGVLLLDHLDGVQLGWGWFLSAASAAIGVILVASGLAARGP